MAKWSDDPLVPLGLLIGGFLIVAGLGTLITQPWVYHGSTAVTVLRITGTLATILVGIGLIYVAWGMDWLAARQA